MAREDRFTISGGFGIERKVAESISKYLETESPLPFHQRKAVGIHCIIGDNRLAAPAALAQAQRKDFEAEILKNELQGEAQCWSLLTKRLHGELLKGKRPFCLIVDGEPTDRIEGNGKGGRNQVLALVAVNELGDLAKAMVISLATEGEDDPMMQQAHPLGGPRCLGWMRQNIYPTMMHIASSTNQAA